MHHVEAYLAELRGEYVQRDFGGYNPVKGGAKAYGRAHILGVPPEWWARRGRHRQWPAPARPVKG